MASDSSLNSAQEDEFSDFLENANVAFHWVGPDGTILWANRAELEFLGYDRDEYVGRNIAEFHADQPVIADILDRLSQNETLHEYPARLRCKDGSIRRVAINSSVYRRNGEFVHTRCFTRNIARDEVTAELQQRLAAIVESSDDAILSKDLNGIIRSWNSGAERIFGYKADEVVGQPITILAAPDRVDEIPNILERLSRGERIEHYRTKRRAKDGRILSISLTISPIRDSLGKVIGASKVARDVTEHARIQEALEAANESLRRSNEDLEQFAYSASHDLQEPLRMISLYTEMLKRKFAGKLEDAVDEYIGFIAGGAARMEHLLRNLRVYSQASTMREAPSKDVDSNESLKKALANLTVALDESETKVISGNLPSLRVHDFQLEQVFQNLIGNAIRYRRVETPEIHVAAERSGERWLFSVKDNGIGIDSKYKEQIFGIFKRLHTNAEHPGTGMGLAICHRIIERTGGRIWVESEPERGSTFFFTLPEGKDKTG